jgi:hypothetical protein
MKDLKLSFVLTPAHLDELAKLDLAELEGLNQNLKEIYKKKLQRAKNELAIHHGQVKANELFNETLQEHIKLLQGILKPYKKNKKRRLI